MATDPDQTLPPSDSAGPRPDPHAGQPTFTPGSFFGRYRIERKLGEGGMGAVFLAHDPQLDRPVALKIPHFAAAAGSSAYTRFVREARAAAALRHPNVCPIYDLGEIGGVPFLCLAFVRGEPLAKLIGPGRPLPVAQAVPLVRTVALALAEAHKLGIIHRDLKPGNILLDERGEPVVMDFGLARREDALATQLTQQGEVLGTPAYMPPEQVEGNIGQMGPAADIYSLGVVLYELVTGVLPFTGDFLSLAAQITLDAPPAPSRRRPGLDARLDAVILKALAKLPAQRYPTMTAFAAALADAVTPLGAGLTYVTPTSAPVPLPPLALRVTGTNAAYRPSPGQEIITVGRQRRKPGEPADAGNDFVVRVTGNDELSLRISRRHCEIRRSANGFSVTDLSKAGTSRNGLPLPKGEAVPLASGDRLTLAGAVTLVVQTSGSDATQVLRTLVEVPAAGPGGGQVHFEATMGDMVTTG